MSVLLLNKPKYFCPWSPYFLPLSFFPVCSCSCTGLLPLPPSSSLCLCLLSLFLPPALLIFLFTCPWYPYDLSLSPATGCYLRIPIFKKFWIQFRPCKYSRVGCSDLYPFWENRKYWGTNYKWQRKCIKNIYKRCFSFFSHSGRTYIASCWLGQQQFKKIQLGVSKAHFLTVEKVP